MSNRYQRVVVVGSVGFDVIMSLPGKFADWIMPDKIHQLNVSFTVNTMRRDYGGTGGNCAYTLGLLGMKPRLVGILGKDGEAYRRHLKRAGVDLSNLTINREMFSAVGHVMTDRVDNQVWSYYPGPLNSLRGIRLQGIVKTGDFVALLPSNPEAFVKHLREVIKLGNDFLFDPAFFIPNLSAGELLMGIKNARIVIGNDYEISLLENKTHTTMASWLDGQIVKSKPTIVIKTLGERGSEIRQGKQVWRIPAAKPAAVVDPTGAGDAYRAGFLKGFVEGKPLAVCGRMGSVAAAYTVEQMGTQTHYFTGREFRKRLKSTV